MSAAAEVVRHPAADFDTPRRASGEIYAALLDLATHDADRAMMHLARFYCAGILLEVEYDLILGNLQLERERQRATKRRGWLSR